VEFCEAKLRGQRAIGALARPLRPAARGSSGRVNRRGVLRSKTPRPMRRRRIGPPSAPARGEAQGIRAGLCKKGRSSIGKASVKGALAPLTEALGCKP